LEILNQIKNKKITGTEQAKFAYGGLVLGSSPFFTIAPAASINDAPFKSGQN